MSTNHKKCVGYNEEVQTSIDDVELSEETIHAMEELGLVLKSIYLEMKKEGYEMVDGKLVKNMIHERKQKKCNTNKSRRDR